MSRTQEILWLTRSPEAHRPLERALGYNGYKVRFVAPPAIDASLSGWLESQIPPEVVAMFLEGEELGKIDALSNALRSDSSTHRRFLPIFWIYENFDVQLVNRVVAIGLDEIFARAGNPSELVARLMVRIQHASEMRRLQRQSAAAQKRDAASETALQQREEFLSVCAHDLRSPIGIIQSGLSTIMESDHKNTLSPFVAEVLSRSYRQAGNALRLVNDLLDVMSFEQGLKPAYEFFNLHEFLTEFCNDFRTQAEEKGLVFEYENPVPGWRVLADSDRVRQLLQNLLANAVRFTESGKHIHLTVTPFKGRRRHDPPYPMAMISLKDEGRGIPQKEVEKIFDRFSQIKDYSRAGGRGLGLTVAKQISNLHAGNLWVESEEGKGSVFHVLLPHVVSRAEAPKRGKDEPKRVLAVEPVDDKRKTYFTELTKAGFEVSFVKDGVEAVAMAFHLLPEHVILRHDTHKMGEAEVARILKENELTRGTTVLVGLETGESKEKSSVADRHVDHFIPLPVEAKSVSLLRGAARQKKAA